MLKMLTRLMLVAMLATAPAVLIGCKEEGPAERAGRSIDEAVDTGMDKAEKAAKEAEKAAKDVADEAEDAADDLMN